MKLWTTILIISFTCTVLSGQNRIGLLTNSPDAPVHIWSSGQVNYPGGLLLLGNRSEAHMELDFNLIQSRYSTLSTLDLMINPLGGDIGIHTMSPASPFHIYNPGQVPNPNGTFLIGNRSEAHLEMDFNFIQSRYNTGFLGLNVQPNGGQFAVGVDKLFIDGNNQVGINTSQPNAHFQVGSDSTLTQLMISPAGISNNSSELILAEDDDHTFGMSLFYHGAANMLQVFGKSGDNSYGPHLSIERNNGNVGIKTNNPQADLHVATDQATAQIMMTPVSNTGGSSEIIFSEDDDNTNNMSVKYNGATNELQFLAKSQENNYGPHLTISRNSGAIDIAGKLSVGPFGSVPDGYHLAVDGKIRAEGIKVDLSGNWADYVFDKNYDLMPIDDVSTFIANHGHLPGFDPAKEMKENGLDLEEITVRQQEKIEELMLYIIELKNEMNALKESLNISENQ